MLVFASRLSCGTAGNAQIFIAIRVSGAPGSRVRMLSTFSAQKAVEGLLVVSSSSDIKRLGPSRTQLFKRTFVEIFLGSLTIESAREGRYRTSVDGKLHK